MSITMDSRRLSPITCGTESGFSLIELMAAITLFSIIVVGFVFARNNALDQARRASDARIYRYLASYQMGILRLGFDQHGNEIEVGEDGGDFTDLGDQYADYRWTSLIEEVVAAGRTADDDDIPSLFAEDDEEFVEADEAEEGDPVTVYRVTLTIIPPDGDGESGLEIVTFKPVPPEAATEGAK
jgi:prepilin-type N-terminal cleavage/methylation domain-containing protein